MYYGEVIRYFKILFSEAKSLSIAELAIEKEPNCRHEGLKLPGDNQSVSTAVLLSLDEFLARPEREDGQREELIEGELTVSPGAKVSHAEIVRRLRMCLTSLEDEGFVVANDFACLLPGASVPSPDLAVVKRERWDQAIRTDSWLAEAPELVIEVASPGNRKLHRKAALYLEHGAEQVWIVYPKQRTVSVFTSDGTTEARIGELIEFKNVSVPVAALFPDF